MAAGCREDSDASPRLVLRNACRVGPRLPGRCQSAANRMRAHGTHTGRLVTCVSGSTALGALHRGFRVPLVLR